MPSRGTLSLVPGMGRALPFLHRVSRADHPAGQDLRPQASPVDQSRPYPFACEALQMATGLAQANSPEADRAHGELPTDQVGERHTAGDDVASGVPGVQRNAVVARQRFDRLDLDEGDLTVGPRLL